MAISRSMTNANTIVDYTEELLVVPNKYGTINQLNLFQEEGVAEHTIQFEEITETSGVLVDRVRGQRGSVGSDRTSKIRAWAVPHFTHDDAIFPSDLIGKRMYGTPDQQDTLANARVQKMKTIARIHADTKELARATLLKSGDVYAPNGTVAMNYYTEFGVSRKEVNFALADGTTDLIGKVEDVISHIDLNAQGASYNGVVGIASPEFFKKFLAHASMKNAFQYYRDGNQQPLRDRLGLIGNQRVLEFGGVTLIEVPGSIAGTRLTTADDCIFVPTGSDIFKTYFSPANRFDMVGSLGEQMYLFEKMGIDQDKYELMSETNFLNAITRPQMVVRAYA